MRRLLVLLTCACLCTVRATRAAESIAGTADTGPAFSARVDRLMGVYEAPRSGKQPTHAIAGALPLTIKATQSRILARRKPDPKDMCQVLGPFRLMARQDVKFEILRDAPDKLVMLFENGSWGNVRNIRLDAEHVPVTPDLRPLWNGDSTARWDGDTLVVDSVHFTNKTWLDEQGVENSQQLHLTERFRLVDSGKYLEYQATAVDPEVLTAPVLYKRLFRRTTAEIEAYNCFDRTPTAFRVAR